MAQLNETAPASILYSKVFQTLTRLNPINLLIITRAIFRKEAAHLSCSIIILPEMKELTVCKVQVLACDAYLRLLEIYCMDFIHIFTSSQLLLK